jgi:hypothetical protein
LKNMATGEQRQVKLAEAAGLCSDRRGAADR